MARVMEGFEDKRLRYWGLGLVFLYAVYIFLRGYLFTGYHSDAADISQFFNGLLETPSFLLILVVMYFSITRLGLRAEDWGLSLNKSLYSMCGFIILVMLYWFFDDPATYAPDKINTGFLITIYITGGAMVLMALLISILLKEFGDTKKGIGTILAISTIVYSAAMSPYNADFYIGIAGAIFFGLSFYFTRSVLIIVFFAGALRGHGFYNGVFVLLIYFILALGVRLLERRTGSLPATPFI